MKASVFRRIMGNSARVDFFSESSSHAQASNDSRAPTVPLRHLTEAAKQAAKNHQKPKNKKPWDLRQRVNSLQCLLKCWIATA